jgi:putative membrane protein
MKSTGQVIGIILIVVLAVLLLGGAGMMGFGGFGMMGGYGGYGGMHGMMGGYGAQGFGFNPFGAILSFVIGALIIGGIVLLVVWLARSGGRTLSGAPSGDAALEIVKARYARGEITQEQFNTIKHDLGV